MKPILGVVLPVYNAEDHLSEQVQQVLDAVTDLTPRFEVLVVDDASTDQTFDVANDLARVFPQVRVVRHARHRGWGAACRTGAVEARGDMIFVQEPDQPFRGTELRRFWFQRDAASNTPAAIRATDSSLIQRLCKWAAALRRERAEGALAEAARPDSSIPARRAVPPAKRLPLESAVEPILVRRSPHAPAR